MKNNSYIGLIIALGYELDISNFDYEIIKQDNQIYYILNNKVILTYSGVGKVNAAISTTLLVKNFNIKNIINIGLAGSCNKSINVGDINLVAECQYGDVDVTCDNSYAINQIPYEKKYYQVDEINKETLSNILKANKIDFVSGRSITIDSFVTNLNKSHFHELETKDAYSIDMEAMAIAQACNLLNTKFNSIKVISDNIYKNNNHSDFQNNITMCRNKINLIIEYIIKDF